MLRHAVIFFAIMLLASTVATALGEAVDLTTYGESTEQARAARYTTIMGSSGNSTSGFYANDANPSSETYQMYQGVYDYVSYPGRFTGANWWTLADGDTTTSSKGTTYDYANDATMVDDFVGYQFKRAASVTEITFSNYSQGDGGTFAAAPRVEVLVGGPLDGITPGTWTEINVSGWGTYQVGNGLGLNTYTVTPDNPTGQVWGVRLIGNPYVESGTTPNDENGYIAVTELQVTGESSITSTVNLSTNLALNQTPIWSHALQFDHPERLTDGLYGSDERTWENGDTDPLDEAHYCGVIFDSAQSNVNAVGITERMLAGGGWLNPEDTVIEYTTDTYDAVNDPDGSELTWTSVSNLDMGRWADTEPILAELMTSMGRWYTHAELMTFDTIPVAITGIRMYGDAYDVEGASDPNGFLATREFEVFAATTPAGIPGDTDGDNDVDSDDATVVASNWGTTGITGGASVGDFNGDGTVDAKDASIMAAQWGDHNESEGTVPEPSSIILLCLGSLMLAAGRRR